MQIVLNIFLGLLPETIYLTLFMIYAKNIMDKRIKLFALVSVVYFLSITIMPYDILAYVVFIALIYAILKLLYRDKAYLLDIFICLIAFAYLSIISYTFHFMGNYWLAYIIARIFIFAPLFLLKSKIRIFYLKYINLWDRKEGNKIKAITIRNISLVSMNIIIFVFNLFMILLTKK